MTVREAVSGHDLSILSPGYRLAIELHMDKDCAKASPLTLKAIELLTEILPNKKKPSP